jgi:glycosyltransferase 2 family protein
LPLRAGDFVRVFAFRSQLQLNAVRLIGSMFVERLVDLLTLLSIFFVTLRMMPVGAFEPWLVEGAKTLAAVVVVAIAVVLLFSRQVHLLMLWFADREVMQRWKLGPRLRSLADQMVEVVDVTKNWMVSVQVLLLSYAAWFFEGLMFWAVARSLGLTTAAISNWFAMAVCTLSTLVPGTPGYVGTFHYFAKESQQAFGCSADDAAAYALVVHFVLWFPVTVVGLICFAMSSHQAVNLPCAVLHRTNGKEVSAT